MDYVEQCWQFVGFGCFYCGMVGVYVLGDYVGEEGEQDEGVDQVGEYFVGVVVVVDVVEGMGEDLGDVGFFGWYCGQYVEGVEDVEGVDDQFGDQYCVWDVVVCVVYFCGVVIGQFGFYDVIDYYFQCGYLVW